MKKKIILTLSVATLGIVIGGCSASFSTNSGDTSAAKPTNTAASPAANKSANSGSTSDKPKTALKDSKKPEGNAKSAKKDNPIPDNWIYVYDEAKGYGFYVPEGTVGESETVDGVDTFLAETPAPSGVAIVVIAFNDKTMTKDDLLNVAVKFLEEMGETVTPGKLIGESDEYAVAEVTTASKDGTKGKGKILVGMDVSDNYVMILGTEEAKFAANEKIIDEIWGSFEMWSGE